MAILISALISDPVGDIALGLKALGRYHRHGSDMRADIKIAM